MMTNQQIAKPVPTVTMRLHHRHLYIHGRLVVQLLQTLLLMILLITKGSCFNSNNYHLQSQQQRTASIAAAASAAAASASEFANDKQLLRKSLDSQQQQQQDSNSLSSRSNVDQISSANFQCPEQFGYYTDSRDCTKYYVCVFGEVLHESCTGGLRFSRELQTCDWPRNVECSNNGTNSSGSSQVNSNNNPMQPQSSQTNSPSSQLSPFQLPSSSTTNQPPTITTPISVSSTSGQLNRQFQAKDTEQQNSRLSANEERAPLKGSSATMVFADEGSDPQQPSFDEAVSPVITADGAIHLHDGSGGTYSLTPNHNNVQRQPQGRQVDVFVKPIAIAGQSSVASSQSRTASNKNQNAQSAATSARQVQALSLTKLQPAMLPVRSAQSQPPVAANQFVSSGQTQPPSFRPLSSSASQQFRSSNPSSEQHFSQPLANSSEQPEEDELPSNEPSSISDQTDQDGQVDPVINPDHTEAPQDGELAGEDESSQQQPGGYIPPVMAHSAPRLPEPPAYRQATRQVTATSSASNRKPVNSRAQSDTFRPTPVEPPSVRQTTGGAFSPLLATTTIASDESTEPSTGVDQPADELENQQERLLAHLDSLARPAARQNLTSHLLRGQLASEQQEANNRQSRMSNQQFNPSTSAATSGRFTLPVIDGATAAHLAAAGLSLNNVNFNDSSKLIRLSSSQFESNQPQAQHGASQQIFFPNQHHHTSQQQQQVQPAQNKPQNKFPLPSSSRSQGNNQSPQRVFATPDVRISAEVAAFRHQDQLGRTAEDGISHPLAVSNTLLVQQQRRARPPKRQQIPMGQTRSRPREQDELTSTTASATSTSPPTTSLPPSSYLSDADESPQEDLGLTRGRHVVVPTTIKFQEDFLKPPTGFMTTTPASLSSARRPAQGQRSANLVVTTEVPTSTLEPSLMATNPSQQAPASTGQAGQADPALVANRYLNSAIDALEAGQPFGTVDYEFDILNDNSTERRQQPGANGQQQHQQRPPAHSNSAAEGADGGATLLNSSNKRQRQGNWLQQTTTGNGGANRQSLSANGKQEADGEGINLTNGPQKAEGGRASSQPQAALPGRLRASLTAPSVAESGSQAPGSAFGSQAGQAASNQQQQQHLQQASQQQQQQQQQQSSSPSSIQQQQVNNSANNKKARPTNKKINVNHEQALANNRASIEPAKRPEAIFPTPTALQQATKCDTKVCRLPDCKCGDTLTPGALDPKVIPQVVLLTFDDAVNDLNWEIYEELFTGRTNPNGCPILATFYVSHEWTDYGQVQTLYSRGHEMASHSITHSFGEKFSKSQWFKEVNGQREILNMYGGVKMNDVRGMRAPFLQIGGNKMFEMLYDANFTYDSSMPIFDNSPPLWPYTLDYQLNHECMITPCPTKSFPGVWEVGMTMWVDLRGGRCSMGDACSNPSDEDGVYEMLMKNFNRHYKSNRAPFGLFYHSAWFNTVHHRRGFLRFMSTVNSLPDVWFVTNWQMLQWMRQPTPISEVNSFEPWQCPAKNDRPPPCFHPSVCNVKSEHGTRFMKTCQPCPANQQYPWVGSTGFKAAKQTAGSSGSG